MAVQVVYFYAFGLGLCLSIAATCSVAAAKRLVFARRADWLIGIFVAVSWSAATLTVLAFVFGRDAGQPTAVEIDMLVISASVAMGLGAYINGSCFIGTIGRLSTGEIACFMTFVGLVLARFLVGLPVVSNNFEQETWPLEHTLYTPVWWFAVIVLSGGFLYGGYRAFVRRKLPLLALCGMGVAAALTFTENPDWTYEAWVGHIVNGGAISRGYETEITILSLFAGATLGSVWRGTFRYQKPSLLIASRCLFGGVLMGVGARFVPGGNDTLLLWVIPSFAMYGLVSYAVMMTAIMAMLIFVGPRSRA